MQINTITCLKGLRSSNGAKRKSIFRGILFGIAMVLGISFDASAQFVVQPMQITAEGRRGSVIKKSFKLENRDRYESHFVTIEVVDLIQGGEGSWLVLDANMLAEADNGIDLSRHSSCKDWISIGRSEVEVPAYDSTTESMEIRIPSNVNGFHCAGLKVALAPRPGQGGVVIKYDFIVPICLTVAGPALRSDVKLQSVQLKYMDPKDDQRESASLVVTIKNDGSTYSKISPSASLWQVLSDGRTRMIKRDINLSEGSIIPGARLSLSTNLHNGLPSGTYKISARLSVDGRRVKGLTQEVEFVNPLLNGLAHEDASMRLIPDSVDLDMNPGRVGNQQIVIHNYSDEDIVVKAIPVVPDALANKFLQVRGEDLSCVDWIEIRPNELPIRAGGERNVSVVVRMPKEEDLPSLTIDPTNYYGTIKFYAFFRDRSSAGTASAMINVKKRGADPTPVIQEKDLKVQGLGQNRFQVVGVFANYGTIHVTPTCTGRILSEGDGTRASQIQYGTLKMVNEDAANILLPFETREFSAEVDFTDIPAGRYIVSARLDYGVSGVFSLITKAYDLFVDSNGERQIFSADENTTPVANSGG